MNKAGSISVLHVILLSMTVIGLKNHVTIIPSLLQGAGRDAWMSVLLAGLAVFPWIYLLIHIHNRTDRESLVDWLQVHIGKKATSVFRYSAAIGFLIMAVFTMAETLQWVHATFLPESPIVLMLLIYTILCIVLVSTNLQVIVMVNVIVLLWVTVLGFFVAFTNIQVKEYSLLRPFLEHGFTPVLKTTIFPASGFVEIILILFIQHKVKERFRWYHFAIMLFLLLGLTMGPLVGAITEFGPQEAMKQRYPAYEEWGLARIGRFIENLDFLSIYQWLTGAFVRVGLILYIVVDLLKLTGDKKGIWRIVAPIFFFLTLPLFLIDDHVFFKIKGDYVLVGTFFFLFLLSLFLGIAGWKKARSSNEKP